MEYDDDIVVLQKAEHRTDCSGIFSYYVTDKHLALVKLRNDGYSAAKIATMIDVPYTTILWWQVILKRIFGFDPPKSWKKGVGPEPIRFYLPCTVCAETVKVREVKENIRCTKHRRHKVWIDPETPAYATRREYERWWYHHGNGKASRTLSSKKWVRKKLATDPVYRERYREYHRQWQAKRKAARMVG